MPEPVVFEERLFGDDSRAEIGQAVDLGVEVRGAKVEVKAVLLALGFGHLLEEEPDAAARFSDGLQVGPGLGMGSSRRRLGR